VNYAIIGSGNLGVALARQFARSRVRVRIANTRSSDSLAELAELLGDKVTPASLENALEADVLILAIPFHAYKNVASLKAHWGGRIVIDAMNARDITPEELGGLESTDLVASALPGARVVKTFNQLPAGLLAKVPAQDGGRRVMFISSNDDDASATVAHLVTKLGFAPVELGRIDEGGTLLRFRGPLVLQNLVEHP
jgi:predicted dinucleotide-binding enzyme